MADSEGPVNGDRPPATIEARFVKSNLCRTVHADGAWGGLTPQLNIHMAIYSDRATLPTSITLNVDPTGIASQAGRVTTQGITREVEVELVMSPEVARAFRDWLDDKLTQVSRAREVLQRAAADEQEE